MASESVPNSAGYPGAIREGGVPVSAARLPANRYSDADLHYMRSLSAAVVERSPRYLVIVVATVALALLGLLLWLHWAEIDEVVRGSGKVIPSRQLQVIQSLEGGVISEILVREGDMVEYDQPLMKISDVPFTSSFEENRVHYLELKARLARLMAEADGAPFENDEEVLRAAPEVLARERSLFETHHQQLQEALQILDEQARQHENELLEVQAKEKQIARSLQLLKEELAIKKPLVESRIVSEVEYLQLRGREAQAEGELESARLSVPRLQSKIDEVRRKSVQTRLDFQNSAKKQLNETAGEASRIAEAQAAIRDRVRRTTLRSPVMGTVKRIHLNTIGGVIKPGSDVVEIVPRGDSLLVEAHIRPSDIANINVGQPVRVKFTAYDFAIYGSLEGEVAFVSADTITNEEGESYYLARIRPLKAHLGHEARPLPIKVGMTSQVDIITGKKTILQYLLKPIHRGMGNALGER